MRQIPAVGAVRLAPPAQLDGLHSVHPLESPEPRACKLSSPPAGAGLSLIGGALVPRLGGTWLVAQAVR